MTSDTETPYVSCESYVSDTTLTNEPILPDDQQKPSTSQPEKDNGNEKPVLKVSGDNDSELSLDQISELETKLADHEWNEEIVQQALTVFAKTPKLAKKTNAIRDIRITKIDPQYIYICELETLMEKRAVEKKAKKAYDEKKEVDDTSKGDIPDRWSVEIPRKAEYLVCEKQKKAIPHSQEIKKCDKCTGFDGKFNTGKMPCKEKTCKLRAKRNCVKCWGQKTVDCEKCKGSGKLLQYHEITCAWHLEVDEIMSKDIPVPAKTLRKAVSERVLSKRNIDFESVLRDFPDSSVASDVRDCIVYYRNQEGEDTKIREQYLSGRRIPMAQVFYEDKKRSGHFYVYGLDHKVYFPECKSNVNPFK